jgi:hypothetical protein
MMSTGIPRTDSKKESATATTAVATAAAPVAATSGEQKALDTDKLFIVHDPTILEKFHASWVVQSPPPLNIKNITLKEAKRTFTNASNHLQEIIDGKELIHTHTIKCLKEIFTELTFVANVYEALSKQQLLTAYDICCYASCYSSKGVAYWCQWKRPETTQQLGVAVRVMFRENSIHLLQTSLATVSLPEDKEQIQTHLMLEQIQLVRDHAEDGWWNYNHIRVVRIAKQSPKHLYPVDKLGNIDFDAVGRLKDCKREAFLEASRAALKTAWQTGENLLIIQCCKNLISLYDEKIPGDCEKDVYEVKAELLEILIREKLKQKDVAQYKSVEFSYKQLVNLLKKLNKPTQALAITEEVLNFFLAYREKYPPAPPQPSGHNNVFQPADYCAQEFSFIFLLENFYKLNTQIIICSLNEFSYGADALLKKVGTNASAMTALLCKIKGFTTTYDSLVKTAAVAGQETNPTDAKCDTGATTLATSLTTALNPKLAAAPPAQQEDSDTGCIIGVEASVAMRPF